MQSLKPLCLLPINTEKLKIFNRPSYLSIFTIVHDFYLNLEGVSPTTSRGDEFETKHEKQKKNRKMNAEKAFGNYYFLGYKKIRGGRFPRGIAGGNSTLPI